MTTLLLSNIQHTIVNLAYYPKSCVNLPKGTFRENEHPDKACAFKEVSICMTASCNMSHRDMIIVYL